MNALAVEAILKRARQWLENSHKRLRPGGNEMPDERLINDLVQLVESLVDKSIARTGEPLDERDCVDAARWRWTARMWPTELLYLLRSHTGMAGGTVETQIDAAMGAAPITREHGLAAEAHRTQQLGNEVGNTSLANAGSIPAESAESALKEAQWVSVPLEPTEEMRIAGQMAIPALPHYEEYRQRTGNQDQPWAYAVACYKAMLAALHRDKPQPHEEG